MLTELISRFIILILAILHPGYKSYKSLRSKNHKEIITWLMYWIVMSMYLALESITDIVLYWLPFYYEVKIIFVLWMVLPATRGYSVIFRKLVHPELTKREEEIDELIEKATEKGYSTILEFGAKAINMGATKVITTGQELLSKRSLSVGDLSYPRSTRREVTTGSASSPTDAPISSFFRPNSNQHQVNDALDFLDSSIADGSGDRDFISQKNSKFRSNIYGTAPRSRLPVVGEEESFEEPKTRERRRVSDMDIDETESLCKEDDEYLITNDVEKDRQGLEELDSEPSTSRSRRAKKYNTRSKHKGSKDDVT